MEKKPEENKGVLKQAISSEKWDSAFKSVTPYNKDITLEDVIEYAKFHNKIVTIEVCPESVIISENKWNGEEDEKRREKIQNRTDD